MASPRIYTLEQVRKQLEEGKYPISGTTPLGTARFHFLQPESYLGVALHSGKGIRTELQEVMAVGEQERFREEDPYTDHFIESFPIRLIATDSRFEYDLNREMETTIYPFGIEKWGLQVWKRPLTEEEVQMTHEKFMEFHALLDLFIEMMLRHFRTIVLFDIHSFCYQREGRINWWEDEKPEINLGTRHVGRGHFSKEIDFFLRESAGIQIGGRILRVGENELFGGGYLTRKFSASHPGRVLTMAIEYKKIYMDEHNGTLYPENLGILMDHLLRTKEKMLRITP